MISHGLGDIISSGRTHSSNSLSANSPTSKADSFSVSLFL